MQPISACLTSFLPCQECAWDVLLTGFKCASIFISHKSFTLLGV